MTATAVYRLMPNLTIDEYEDLRESIRDRGVLVPIEVDENGTILDGHHRLQACEELGIECPRIVREGLTDDQKVAHVLTLNLDRRQLDRDQRAELVKQLRHRQMSIRAIAEVVKVSPATVHADLAGVQDRTPEPEPVVGRDGKAYQARRPPKAKPIFTDEEIRKNKEHWETVRRAQEERRSALHGRFVQAALDRCQQHPGEMFDVLWALVGGFLDGRMEEEGRDEAAERIMAAWADLDRILASTSAASPPKTRARSKAERSAPDPFASAISRSLDRLTEEAAGPVDETVDTAVRP